jgi:uncharacterized zinc-type alcohol dehydrogenase-like protein
MTQFHGLATHAAGAELLPYKYEVGELGEHEVEVKISHCGVCHSDVHLIDNDWGISKYPFIPGHEIVGTVTAVGSNVRSRKPGERVGIGWQADSCGICEWCRQGDEQLCALAEPTCVGRNGGYADLIRVNSRFAIPVPAALESENVAPLLCGGITVYSPLRNYGVRPASRVGVIGIGGLGHMGLQFANAFGAEVTAFSTSKNKEEEAKTMGAHHFINTRDTGALKKAFALISGQKQLAGSPTGSPRDIHEMLDVAARHGVKAITERFPMAKANEAVARVKKNLVRYRAVLSN